MATGDLLLMDQHASTSLVNISHSLHAFSLNGSERLQRATDFSGTQTSQKKVNVRYNHFLQMRSFTLRDLTVGYIRRLEENLASSVSTKLITCFAAMIQQVSDSLRSAMWQHWSRSTKAHNHSRFTSQQLLSSHPDPLGKRVRLNGNESTE